MHTRITLLNKFMLTVGVALEWLLHCELQTITALVMGTEAKSSKIDMSFGACWVTGMTRERAITALLNLVFCIQVRFFSYFSGGCDLIYPKRITNYR